MCDTTTEERAVSTLKAWDKKLSQHDALDIIGLRAEGWKWQKIADRYGVSMKTPINRTKSLRAAAAALPEEATFELLRIMARQLAVERLGTYAEPDAVDGLAAILFFHADRWEEPEAVDQLARDFLGAARHGTPSRT
ncbi:hypothetical protein EFN44_08415 [Propionibacterium freudenreichii]|nr:hypothetical protein [Propionibacterium freudenreichii]